MNRPAMGALSATGHGVSCILAVYESHFEIYHSYPAFLCREKMKGAGSGEMFR